MRQINEAEAEDLNLISAAPGVVVYMEKDLRERGMVPKSAAGCAPVSKLDESLVFAPTCSRTVPRMTLHILLIEKPEW